MSEIIDIITEYANAYKRLDDFQKNNTKIIPIGDQKTGAIGEFLGMNILKQFFPNAEIKLSGNHSQKGFDITVYENNDIQYFQVKTISDYSRTGISSKISLNFNHNVKLQNLNGLLIILLEKNLLEGKYILLKGNEVEEYEGKRLVRKKIINHPKIKQFKYGKNL